MLFLVVEVSRIEMREGKTAIPGKGEEEGAGVEAAENSFRVRGFGLQVRSWKSNKNFSILRIKLQYNIR